MLFASTALAAEPGSEAPKSPRVRFGAGYWSGVGAFKIDPSPFDRGFDPGYQMATGAVGGALDLGVQIRDWLAVFAFGRLTTLLFSNLFSAGAMVELTMASGWVSLATGAAVAAYAYGGYGGGGSGVAVGLPVRLSVNVGTAGQGPTRHRFFLSLEGWVGLGTGGDSRGFAGYFGGGLGYTMM